jgi:IMP dehydrogenase
MFKNFEETLTYDDVLLVPQFSDIESRADVDVSTVLHKNLKLGHPIIPANMDTVAEHKMAIATARAGGICYIHRYLTIEQQVDEVKKVKKEGLIVGASIGVKEEDKDRLKALLDAGVDSVLLDIAHGHSKRAGEMVQFMRKSTKLPIMAGNVATPEAVKYLASKGADIVKVGIGPGATCTTRIVTGFGVPQLSAVLVCAKEAKKQKISIVADGGIYDSGSITKALAAGADAVMFGKLFAATDEAPGEVVEIDGKKFKNYRGMASSEANRNRVKNIKNYVPEGVNSLVAYDGPAENVFNNLLGGLRSGLSYCGARNIKELQKKARFIKITSTTIKENNPHGVTVLK